MFCIAIAKSYDGNVWVTVNRKCIKLSTPGLRGMREKLNVHSGIKDQASRMTPEALSSQTRAIIWSVSLLATASNLPTAPATEEEIVDFAAFFTIRGKAARNKTRLITFRSKVRREKRSLQKRLRQVHEIHKYFDEISVSIFCFVCPTCHLCICFWRFCMRFLVLAELFCGFGWFFLFGFAVSHIMPQRSLALERFDCISKYFCSSWIP